MTKKRRAKGDKKLKVKKIHRVDTGEFVDRELSMLEFNKRVLEQAADSQIPILDRARFLSIFHSNLDEFFMKRVDLSRRLKIYKTIEGETGEEKVFSYNQLSLIRKSVVSLLNSATECFENSLKPALKENGIHLLNWKELSKAEIEFVNEYYNNKIFPVLTPLAVDPGHPFPHISNQSTSLAVCLKYEERPELFFARIKVPEIFPDWVQVNAGKNNEQMRWISIHEIIENNLQQLFPNMKIVSSIPFRVIRNIDLERDEGKAENLMEMVEEELKERKFGVVVKLEHGINADPWIIRFLQTELEISQDDTYEMQSLINFSSLNDIADIDIPEFHFPEWVPTLPEKLNEEALGIFHCMSEADILLHHPFESFSTSVERFVKAAASDPEVQAIKITLYRTNENSRIIRSLINAAENGKQVVCLIELTARLDEYRNIQWAKTLEDAGVHIVYGLVGYKTHCKATLVVRREDGEMKCYAHIGTGNYNSNTAKLYTDMGILTANQDLTKELVILFNHLTGRSQKHDYQHLLVAPTHMKSKFLELIDHEITLASTDKPAEIIVKCNGLTDREIARKLYEASASGVKIELLIRGICILKPGVEGLSENISVTSVVDRFLEHSRIFYFRNGQKLLENGKLFIGSGDWMTRNLNARVEVATPIYDQNHKKRILEVLEIYKSSKKQSWTMKPDGTYKRNKATETNAISAQEKLMLSALNRNED